MAVELPVSFGGTGYVPLAWHAYYKTRGMLIRSVIHKLLFWRRVRGIAFIHRSVEIYYPSLLYLGSCCVLHRNGKLNALCRQGVRLGKRVTLADGFWIQGTSHLRRPGEGMVIGDHTYIGPNAILGFHGPVAIGAHCAIGANFQISAQSHDMSAYADIAIITVPSKGITIGNYCWIGNDVKITDGVVIGRGAVVGAGAVVTRSVPDYAVVAGVPARVLRIRDGADTGAR
jgi:acetyltransferase-like isoleucine patch superfamily enzyme